MDKTTREQKAQYWKAQIDSIIRYEKGSSQSKLIQELAKEYGWTPNRASFSSRLNRGTITLVELSEILELYGKKPPKLYEQ